MTHVCARRHCWWWEGNVLELHIADSGSISSTAYGALCTAGESLLSTELGIFQSTTAEWPKPLFFAAKIHSYTAIAAVSPKKVTADHLAIKNYRTVFQKK